MKKIKILFLSIFCFSFLGLGFAFSETKAVETKLLTPKASFKIFYEALNKHQTLLNDNNKSGYQGAYDYIAKEIGTTTIAQQINNPNLFDNKTGAREKLDWFKGKFLVNTNINNGGLNQRDKEGIKQAMVATYNYICLAGVKKDNVALLKWFSEISAGPQATKKAAIKTCETTFANAIKALDSTEVWSIEGVKITRDICINNAYSAYNNSIKNLYDSNATSTLASAVNTKINACKADPRITNWNWAQ